MRDVATQEKSGSISDLGAPSPKATPSAPGEAFGHSEHQLCLQRLRPQVLDSHRPEVSDFPQQSSRVGILSW